MADIPKFIKVTRVYIALEQSPKHAEALGLLLGHWAVFGHMLTGLMQNLLDIEPQKADIVYKEIVNFQAKLKLLKRINHHFTKDKAIKDEIDNVLATAEKLNKQRNAFIHASWAGDSTNLYRYENVLPGNPVKLSKAPMKFTPQDILNVVEEIAKLSASCGMLSSQLLTTPQGQP
jgi:hypothetical protein